MEEKIQWYKEVLTLEPNSRLFFPLAVLLSQNGQLEEALETLREGLKRHDEYLEARIFYIELLYSAKRMEDIKPQLQKLEGMFSHYVGFWQAWAAYISSDGESMDAASIMRFLSIYFSHKHLSLHEIIDKGIQAILREEGNSDIQWPDGSQQKSEPNDNESNDSLEMQQQDASELSCEAMPESAVEQEEDCKEPSEPVKQSADPIDPSFGTLVTIDKEAEKELWALIAVLEKNGAHKVKEEKAPESVQEPAPQQMYEADSSAKQMPAQQMQYPQETFENASCDNVVSSSFGDETNPETVPAQEIESEEQQIKSAVEFDAQEVGNTASETAQPEVQEFEASEFVPTQEGESAVTEPEFAQSENAVSETEFGASEPVPAQGESEEQQINSAVEFEAQDFTPTQEVENVASETAQPEVQEFESSESVPTQEGEPVVTETVPAQSENVASETAQPEVQEFEASEPVPTQVVEPAVAEPEFAQSENVASETAQPEVQEFEASEPVPTQVVESAVAEPESAQSENVVSETAQPEVQEFEASEPVESAVVESVSETVMPADLPSDCMPPAEAALEQESSLAPNGFETEVLVLEEVDEQNTETAKSSAAAAKTEAVPLKDAYEDLSDDAFANADFSAAKGENGDSNIVTESFPDAVITEDFPSSLDELLHDGSTVSLRTRSMAEVLAEQGDIRGALDIYCELEESAESVEETVDLKQRIATLRTLLARQRIQEGKNISPMKIDKSRVINLIEALSERLEARAQN